MDLLFPLKQALATPLRDILIFLSISLAAAFLFYLYFWFRFARQKDLIKSHHVDFKETEKCLKNLEFKGLPISDFFGKKQHVQLPDGQFGKTLIFYPELSNESSLERFRSYHELLEQQPLPCFPKNRIDFQNNQLVQVESQYFQSNGETLINLAQYNISEVLSASEKEQFLLDVAYMLEALHQLQTPSGESLYHGFLIPSSFYFSINLVKKITHIYLSDHGCAFALGAEKFQNWLSKFYQGKYIVDASVKKELNEYAYIFSPEQKSQNVEVTSSTDFYSFAALAVTIFTGRAFDNPSDILWEKVPLRWRAFLEQCLEKEPQSRPAYFSQLQEDLNEPDHEIESNTEDIEEESSQQEGLDSIEDYFEQMRKQKAQALAFDSMWQEGFTSLKSHDFDRAGKIFSAMLNQDPNSFDAHLGFALMFYQKGDQKKAKEHYQFAKKIDAKRINYFHRLIAFDI